MAVKIYTESEMQNLVLLQINAINKLNRIGLFSQSDASNAYDSAVRECGYTVPSENDSDINLRNHWLIERMRYWYFARILEKLALLQDFQDIDGSGLTKRLMEMLAKMDDDFKCAKESVYGYIFTSSENTSTPVFADVYGHGIVENRIGIELTQR